MSRGLQQTRQRRSVGTESHGRSLRLLGMSATCGGRLGENFGNLGGRTAWAGRKIVEFFGTHLQGSICGGKCFAAAAKQLPPVNWSASRFLQPEIIFFKGYSNFLCGGPKVPLPASQPLVGVDLAARDFNPDADPTVTPLLRLRLRLVFSSVFFQSIRLGYSR